MPSGMHARALEKRARESRHDRHAGMTCAGVAGIDVLKQIGRQRCTEVKPKQNMKGCETCMGQALHARTGALLKRGTTYVMHMRNMHTGTRTNRHT